MLEQIVKELEVLKSRARKSSDKADSEISIMYHLGGSEYINKAIEIVRKYQNQTLSEQIALLPNYLS